MSTRPGDTVDGLSFTDPPQPNIAVFGVDSRDGNTKNALADVQVLCSINQKNGDIKLVSVYRDTYLKVDSKGSYHKINEAYFKDTKQAVSALKKIPSLRSMIMQHLTGKQRALRLLMF